MWRPQPSCGPQFVTGTSNPAVKPPPSRNHQTLRLKILSGCLLGCFSSQLSLFRMSTAHGHHLSRAPCVLSAALRLPLGLSERDCRVVEVAELSVSSSISVCSDQSCLGHLGFAGRIAKPLGTPVVYDCGSFPRQEVKSGQNDIKSK